MTRRRFIAIAAAACLLFAAIGGGVAYGTESAYVSIEMTAADGSTMSSIELGVNCFGITISAEPQDDWGSELLADASVLHKPYADAVNMLIAAAKDRQIVDGSYAVVVAVSSDDAGQASALADASALAIAGQGLKADCLTTDLAARDEARDAGTSTARYQTYLDLRDKGADVSLEECISQPLPELRERDSAADRMAAIPANGAGDGEMGATGASQDGASAQGSENGNGSQAGGGGSPDTASGNGRSGSSAAQDSGSAAVGQANENTIQGQGGVSAGNGASTASPQQSPASPQNASEQTGGAEKQNAGGAANDGTAVGDGVGPDAGAAQ